MYKTEGEAEVRDVEETLAAQNKLARLHERFSTWVWEDDERAQRLAAVYNRTFNSVVVPRYDGTHLSFPDMNEQWARTLYPWQRDFVWRMVTSRAALCGHPVVAGKTTTEIAGAMTLRRLGLVGKAAIVVPNHLLEQIAAEAQRLYPGTRMLIISRDDLSREMRKLFAARVALGDYDLVIMTHAGLGALKVHPDTEYAYIERRLALYRQALIEQDDRVSFGKRRGVKRLEKAIERMRQRQAELLQRKRYDGVTFEQLGVSYLIIDEAHQYKNLGLPTNIKGLQVQAAKRAVDLEMKLRWLEEHCKGRPYASFFTATPLSNNMVEAYVQGWYLDQELLRNNGLYTVDAFASVFIEIQTRVEVAPNGASFQLYTGPTRFVNMPEFATLLAQFMDLRGPEILDDKRPQLIEHTVTLAPEKTMQAFVDDLVERSDLIHRGQPREMPDGKRDNMLWVTLHGRAAALDLSLVGLTGARSLKLEAVASKMLEVYQRGQREAKNRDGEFKGLQIGFCDLGTPHEHDEQVYGLLKRLLCAAGISAHGIRYVHEAKTDTAKELLFQQCRRGEVAILLGSTTLLGTGTNIQRRCMAIHHIDAPWRPDELEQRQGRGHRPGNVNAIIEVFRYVQQRTFDAFSWQTLYRKAVFFDQLRSGKITSREMDELGETALTYAQVKAAATGDRLILEHAELEVTIVRLQRLLQAHLRARRRDVQEAIAARESAEHSIVRAANLRTIAARAKDGQTPFFLDTSGQAISKGELGEMFAHTTQRLILQKGGYQHVGTCLREQVTLLVEVRKKHYNAEVLIGDRILRFFPDHAWLSQDERKQFVTTLMQEVNTAGAKADQEEGYAAEAKRQAVQLEMQARQPFPYEDELREHLKRKEALDAYLVLWAQVKDDSSRQDELVQVREQLLTRVADFSSMEDPTVQPELHQQGLLFVAEGMRTEKKASRRHMQKVGTKVTQNTQKWQQPTLFSEP